MSWADAQKSFAERSPSYSPRESQDALALAAESALTRGAHLGAQAPCGVGKSFVAQVTAIDYAYETGQPVVLSTGTKALQDQYIRDAEAMQQLYKPFKFTVLKGRSNYACQAKIAEGVNLSVNQVELEKALVVAGGDLDQLALSLTPMDRVQISTTSEECPGRKECKFGEMCFAERAKDRAKDSQVVIANHAITVLDAQLKRMSEGVGPALLPEYSALIVDEAHELEQYATSILGSELSERAIRNLAIDGCVFIDDDVRREKMIGEIGALYAALTTVLPKAPSRDTTAALTPEVLLEIGDPLVNLITSFKELSNKVAAFTIHGDDNLMQKRKRLQKRLGNMRVKLANIIQADFSDLVRWVERESKVTRNGETFTQILLKSAPLSVAADLKATLWDLVPAVLMSATLAVGNDFGYLRERLGLADMEGFDCESPFNFSKQAKIFIPDNDAAKINDTLSLVRASDGRALLLFTSWTNLNSTYEILKPEIQAMGHRVFKQGEMGTRALAQAFAEDEHSVLFAVKSFFTGVDVQGDSLRLVVIDKAPFPVPSDVVFKARCDLLDAKASNKWVDGAFPKLSVPMMALDLMQGAGRLIRTVTDEGLIAIMDSRLSATPKVGKPYGKKIREALPPAPIVSHLSDAVDYLQKLDA